MGFEKPQRTLSMSNMQHKKKDHSIGLISWTSQILINREIVLRMQ